MYLTNLEKLILKSGVKKKHIAENLNIKYDTLRRKLNGESDFKVEELLTICKSININIKEVFKNEDN